MQSSAVEEETRVIPVKLNWKLVLFNTLKTLNLFKSNTDDDDVEKIHRQRLSTRLYLSLCSIVMVALVSYAALLSRTIILSKSKPSEHTYRDLYTRFFDTLKCPCSRATVQYNAFVHSQVSFHEVCQSQFISQEWINEVYHQNVSLNSPIDIRSTFSAFWQLVRSFCDLTKNTLTDALTDFNATLLITPAVQSQFMIETRIHSSLNFSLTSVVTNLKRNLNITRDLTLGDGLMSGLATNYRFFSNPLPDSDRYSIEVRPNTFADDCSCSNFAGCLQPAVLFESNDTLNGTNIVGMMFDCLPSDAALASSLECFFKSWCLSLIQNHLSINFTPDLLSGQSRFAQDTTLQTLIDELMIEQLRTTIDFSAYYAQCNPFYCTYSYSRRFDTQFIFILIASAFSGVSVVLRLISPFLIKLLFMIYDWKTKRNVVRIDNTPQSKNYRKSYDKVPVSINASSID